jgi:hypothetical protein
VSVTDLAPVTSYAADYAHIHPDLIDTVRLEHRTSGNTLISYFNGRAAKFRTEIPQFQTFAAALMVSPESVLFNVWSVASGFTPDPPEYDRSVLEAGDLLIFNCDCENEERWTIDRLTTNRAGVHWTVSATKPPSNG